MIDELSVQVSNRSVRWALQELTRTSAPECAAYPEGRLAIISQHKENPFCLAAGSSGLHARNDRRLDVLKVKLFDLDQVKAAIKEIAFGEFLTLQGHGLRHNTMICPFCGSGTGPHRTPAFHLFPDNHFRCFSCQANGDIIDFVMQANKLEYLAAMEYIAKEMGVPIPERQKGDHLSKGTKVQVGSKFIFNQEKNLIVEVPRYRHFHDHEAAEIFTKKRDLEKAERLIVALASMAMVMAEHDEDMDLIIELMGNDFEKRYFALMKDKRFAFGKMIEWRNKNLKREKEQK